jgi:hypothetical protein
MEAARFLKSKQPHSMVEVKDLKSGEAGSGTANPAYRSAGAVGGDCWSSISLGFSAALPR